MENFENLDGSPAMEGLRLLAFRCHPATRGYRRQQILASLDQMDLASVEAVWLVDVCGLSYKAAAISTHSTVAVFTRRLHAARVELIASNHSRRSS